MEILIDNEKRNYDENFAKKFYLLIDFIKLSWKIVFVIWVIISMLYIFNIHNNIVALYIVPFLYSLLMFIFIMIFAFVYYYSFWNQKIGDSKYLGKYYPLIYNRLKFSQYKKILFSDYLLNEDIDRKDEIIQDIKNRIKLRKYLLIPLFFCFIIFIVNMGIAFWGIINGRINM